MKRKMIMAAIGGMALAAGSAMAFGDNDVRAQAVALMKSSFESNGQATVDRLEQDGVQAVCNGDEGKANMASREALQKAELAAVKFPADGKYMGDFKAG